MAEEDEPKKKKRPDPPLTRDAVIKRVNARQDVSHQSPLATLQEIFEETDDKNRFIGDTMFWKYFEDINTDRVKDTSSVEYLNLRIMFFETIFFFLLLLLFTTYAYFVQSTSVYEARQEQLQYWGGCNQETGDCRIDRVRDLTSLWKWMSHDFIPNAFTQYATWTPLVANITTSFGGNDYPLFWSPRFIGPARSNVFLGSVRMRALRVKKNSGCEVSRLYQHVYPDCYGKYTSSSHSADTYYPRFVPTYLRPSYVYKNKEETFQSDMDGKMGSYPGGGFVIDFPVNKTDSLSMIEDLKKWYWVDRSTRAIILEFNTLAINANIIVNSRILFELGATGSVKASHDCSAAQVFFFQTTQKAGAAFNVYVLFFVMNFLFACQTLWCFYLMYKTCMNFLGGGHSMKRAMNRVVYKLKKKPCKTMCKGFKLFFKTFYHYLRYEWNLMDFMILSLWFIHVGFRAYTYNLKAGYENLSPAVIGHPEKFMPFSNVMVPLVRGLNVLAILSILMWIKAFKYLCMISNFRLLVRILERCAKELVLFAFVLLIIFFSCAICFFVAYGRTDEDFSTLTGSYLVLFFMLMDGFKPDPWWFSPEKLRIMPIVFFAYITLVYFVLLNVFLAIVLDVYAFTNHVYVIQHAHKEDAENPMWTFLRTFSAWMKGISLVERDTEENLRSEDLVIELELLPGLVRRKWIEKKRKMQRVADASFAGLTLFPGDEGVLFERAALAGTDWTLPNTRTDMNKMINAQASKSVNTYDIPQAMVKQEISRAQLQRLMDEDDSLPLLLGETSAVNVIRKFRRKAFDEEDDDEDARDPISKTQGAVFAKLDELERIAPEVEVPKHPVIVDMTHEMSHALSEVQMSFRVELTTIIEATATLFEHLVELTQGVDAVRTNHEEVLQLVRENAADEEGATSSMRTGSNR